MSRGVDIFCKRHVNIFVNMNGDHWSLCTIVGLDNISSSQTQRDVVPCLLHMDSMSDEDNMKQVPDSLHEIARLMYRCVISLQ
jgi:hypothetical protein